MKIDWREYFREFSSVHGGQPILYGQDKEKNQGGYWLFSDGWMYATNPIGPEYPPPENEEAHKKLISHYWGVRHRVLTYEYDMLKQSIKSLVTAQQNRSVALQVPQSYVQEDDDGKNRRLVRIQPINFSELISELQTLAVEIQHCQNQIIGVTIPEVDTYQFSPASVLAELEEVDMKVNKSR